MQCEQRETNKPLPRHAFACHPFASEGDFIHLGSVVKPRNDKNYTIIFVLGMGLNIFLVSNIAEKIPQMGEKK